MTIIEYKKIARVLKEVYAEIEKQAISHGVDIFSEEYKTLIDKAREGVLNKAGFTLEEYRGIKDSYTSANKQKVNQEIEVISKKIEDIKSIPLPIILTKEEIKTIAHDVAKEYIKPPQITNQIVKEITKEITIEKPKIIETTRQTVVKEKYNAKPLEEKISKLENKINSISIPEPVDIESIKSDLKLDFDKELKHNIDILGMPDFRKLAMGLQSQIDSLGSSTGSGTPAGSNTEIQYNNNGVNGASPNLTFNGSLQTITADSLGVTQDNTKGFFIRNTTAAAAGAQQMSPSIHWQGQGWRTTATAESRPVDFRAYVYTYQGSTNPNGMWFLDSSVNGGTYTQRFGVGLNGDLYLSSGGSGTSGQVLQSGGANIASSWLTLNSIATAGLSNGSGTTASGNSLNWAGTLTTNADINANDSYRVMISNIAANHAGISYATNEPKVTWDIDGSWGLRRRLVDNTEHTVEYFDSIISVKTDSSTGAVVLPDASTSTGRIITVKFYDNTSVYNIGVSASSGNVQSASDFSLGGSYSMPITGQRAISWQSNGTDWEIVWTQGIGDVVGPASATDNNVVFFDGTTGKLIKDSGITLSGTNTGDQTTITGNAGTATTLQTTRTIWGQNFNGSANVTGNLTLGTGNLTMTGSLAATGARVTKGWFTDIESTNMITVGGTSLSSIFQGLDTQLTSLAGLSYTGNALKVIRVNAGETDFELATLAGGSGLTHPEVMSRVSLRF